LPLLLLAQIFYSPLRKKEMSNSAVGNVVNIDDVLAQLAANPQKNTSKKTAESKRRAARDCTVYETCNDVLDMYVNAAATRPDIEHAASLGRPDLTLPIGADPTLRELMTEQRRRVKLQNEMDTCIVGEVERVVRGIRKEEKHIGSWHASRVAELETSRKGWYTRADSLARTRGEVHIPSRVSVEREWIDLARTLPRGHARDIMEAGVPLGARAALAELAGGDVSNSMVSRTRRQESVGVNTQTVQWKLRHSVDDAVDNHLTKANRAAEMAIRSVSSGAVRRCRESIDTSKATFDANDAIAENKAQLLMQHLHAKNIAFKHLMGYCAEITRRNRAVQMNRLARLLREK